MSEKCPNAGNRDLAGICTVGPAYCQGCVESAKRVADGMIDYRDEKIKVLNLQVGEMQKAIDGIAPYCKVKYGMPEEAVNAIERLEGRGTQKPKDEPAFFALCTGCGCRMKGVARQDCRGCPCHGQVIEKRKGGS